MAKSIFHDLFPAEEAAELEMRAKLLSGINKWLFGSLAKKVERGSKRRRSSAGVVSFMTASHSKKFGFSASQNVARPSSDMLCHDPAPFQ